MNTFLGIISIGIFVILLLVNVYFRFKILQDYRYLVKNKIEFGGAHILNRKRLTSEILPQYPDHQKQILAFCNKIRFAFRAVIALMILLVVLAFVLNK